LAKEGLRDQLQRFVDHVDNIHPQIKRQTHNLTLYLKHLVEYGHLPLKRLRLETISYRRMAREVSRGEPLEKLLEICDLDDGHESETVTATHTASTATNCHLSVSSPCVSEGPDPDENETGEDVELSSEWRHFEVYGSI
jgi:hypothetical protein